MPRSQILKELKKLIDLGIIKASNPKIAKITETEISQAFPSKSNKKEPKNVHYSFSEYILFPIRGSLG